MPKLAICIPCMDEMPVPTVLSLLSLYAFVIDHPLYKDVDEKNDVSIFIERNSLLVSSRQNLIQRALDWDAEWILMLDSDMTFPADTFHQLAKHSKPVVACNYVKRVVPTVPITKDFDNSIIYTDRDTTGLQKAKFTGFGVCLVHSEVFRNIPPPWFDTQWIKDNETGSLDILGEDVFFFEAMRHFTKQDLWIDHDLSQHVQHVGQFEYHNSLGGATRDTYEDGESTST